MTARRRRKSGSGPSATALIAWVGGTEIGSDHTAGASGVYVPAPVVAADERSPLIGRARGLAAGTLLACGSVLAVSVHAADSSGLQQVNGPGFIAIGPGAASGGQGATSPVARPAAPAVTGAQAFAGSAIPPGPVHRNVPLDVNVPRAALSEVPAPLALGGPRQGRDAARGPVERAVAPVAQSAAQAPRAIVGEVDAVSEGFTPLRQELTPAGSLGRLAVPATQDVPASVQEMLAPLDDMAPLDQVVAQFEAGTHPAMAMLSALSQG